MQEFNFNSDVNTTFYTVEQLETLCSALSELPPEKLIKLVVSNNLIDTTFKHKQTIIQPTSLDLENDQLTNINTCIFNDLVYVCLSLETGLPDVCSSLKNHIFTVYGSVRYELLIFKNNKTANNIYNLSLISDSFMLSSFFTVDNTNQKASLILAHVMDGNWKTFDIPFELVNGSIEKSFHMILSILLKEIVVYKSSVTVLNDLGISYDGLSGIDDEHLKLIEMLFI